MTGQALTPAPMGVSAGWTSPRFQDLRVFDAIPPHRHDIVTLAGAVIVYETDCLCREPIEDGGIYVIESQHPVAGMSYQAWLDREAANPAPRAQPDSPLKTRREVVQVVQKKGHWWQVQPSGFHDGPFSEWTIAHNMVGKVAGIYQPGRERAE